MPGRRVPNRLVAGVVASWAGAAIGEARRTDQPIHHGATTTERRVVRFFGNHPRCEQIDTYCGYTYVWADCSTTTTSSLVSWQLDCAPC